MRRELQQIPPAPRTPRWPPVLWARWPLAFLAFVGAVYGGVITLMFYHAAGGKPGDDTRLDRDGRRTVGKVTATNDQGSPAATDALVQVFYAYRDNKGRETKSFQFLPRDRFHTGDDLELEFLPKTPEVSRVVGTRISNLPDLATPLWRWFVLPGVASLGLWLFGIWRTRSLLRTGDVAMAELLSVRPVRFVVPGMLRVSYRFLDRHALQRSGHHWVRRRSCLGAKLCAAPVPQSAPVVHDRTHPWRNRVVTVDDFVLAPASPHLHADTATPWTHDP